MTTQPHQEDLFGNPVDDQPAPTRVPSSAAASWVNDMDLAQSVLADVVDEKTPVLHHDEEGAVTRCQPRRTVPVAGEVAAVVNQLINARYLTTARRHGRCTAVDHGTAVTATPAGRSAHHRWNAFHRPAAWGPCGGHVDTGGTTPPTSPNTPASPPPATTTTARPPIPGSSTTPRLES